jgi:putative ABC transport system permease protein
MVKADMPGIGSTDVGLSQPELADLQRRLGVFEQVSSVDVGTANLTGGTRSERVDLSITSTSYFALLSARARLGRVFDQSDYRDGYSDAILISDASWRRKFGASERVLGQTIRLDTDPYTIVGVLPPEFHDPIPTVGKDVQVWSACGYAGAPFSPPARSDRLFGACFS